MLETCKFYIGCGGTDNARITISEPCILGSRLSIIFDARNFSKSILNKIVSKDVRIILRQSLNPSLLFIVLSLTLLLDFGGVLQFRCAFSIS